VILNLESLLAGEYAENEFRKEFTASDGAAIGAAIEKEIGKQQGKQLVQNISQVEPVKTRDLIAQRAGFGNPTTMAQAQRVLERGTPEVIHAMGFYSATRAAISGRGRCRF
jgi:ParB family chromosome partitioning protein